MTIRKIVFAPGEHYHIYSRGVDKRLIFLDDKDKKRFVRLLFLCNSHSPVVYKSTKHLPLDKIPVIEKLVAIGAHCPMSNHFHLLLKEVTEGGIVKFMSKLLTAYSAYFNKKYERTGTLFSSEFKATHLDTDGYLKYMFAYIHLNPLKLFDPAWRENGIRPKTAKKVLENYKFSSYADYAKQETREEGLILDKEAFPQYFETEEEFLNYIFDWLTKNPTSVQALPLDRNNI